MVPLPVKKECYEKFLFNEFKTRYKKCLVTKPLINDTPRKLEISITGCDSSGNHRNRLPYELRFFMKFLISRQSKYSIHRQVTRGRKRMTVAWRLALTSVVQV